MIGTVTNSGKLQLVEETLCPTEVGRWTALQKLAQDFLCGVRVFWSKLDICTVHLTGTLLSKNDLRAIFKPFACTYIIGSNLKLQIRRKARN